MYFEEPYKKKQDTDIFKYVLFSVVVGVTIYTIFQKTNIKPKMTSFSRARASSSASSYDRAFQSFMASRGT